MKRILLLLCTLLIAVEVNASVIDAPHNDTNNIVCSDCHSYSFWWRYSPASASLTPTRESIVDDICATCHKDGGCAPVYPGHSSAAMTSLHNPNLPDWSRACTDCHNPHRQDQLQWASTNPDELYLVSGDIQQFNVGNATVTETGCDGTEQNYSITQFHYINEVSNWSQPSSSWISKNGLPGRGLIMAISAPGVNGPVTNPVATYEVISVDETFKNIVVRGRIDPQYNTDGGSFGLIYGQLIRDRVNNSPVKFFDPNITPDSTQIGGLANATTFEGLCQVCHTYTENWTRDSKCRDLNDNEIVCQNPPDQHYSDKTCLSCHEHGQGFGGKGHTVHELRSGFSCDNLSCHGAYSPPLLADGKTLATTTVCSACHNNGKWTYDAQGNPIAPGPPNRTDYKANFENENYVFGCFGCHNGMPVNSSDETVINMGSTDCDPARNCKDCHSGATTPLCTGSVCSSCHDGTGMTSGLPASDDLQRDPVGMVTAGHKRLVSTEWIRKYPCYYCHADTVDKDGKPIPGGKHLNSVNLTAFTNDDANVDVVIDSRWAIDAQDPAYYTDEHHPPTAGEEANSCYNTYCHSDGTTVNPKKYAYPWDGGNRECYACHGHAPSSNCSAVECHGPDDTRSWDDYPGKTWLSAMPMYKNVDANGNSLTGKDGANSHPRHLFTGLSCDECHFNTVVGDCLDCHLAGDLQGTSMSEKAHVNPAYHITDRKKTVVFKRGGTYNPANDAKTCDVSCHPGYQPQWGGSVLDSVTCKACHGVNGDDVDDFGVFNGVRAKINLTEWSTTGHGRPASAGNYASGNPPAAFPQNGCWYCHDSTVLHQVDDRPFRLIQHDQFNKRFEKECVFCHMTESDVECLGCHNDAESLAPQLDTILADSSVINPPYTISRPDHSTYNLSGAIDGETSCVSACHSADDSRHKTGAGVWSSDQKNDVKNSYIKMGVCLKCHDDDNRSADGSYNQCYTCHARPVDDPLTTNVDESMRYELGFDPGLPGTYRITPQKAKAASFHFGHKHYADYVKSLAVDTVSGTVSDTMAALNELTDSSKNWSENKWYGYYVKMYDGPNIGEVRKITGNSSDTLFLSPDFAEPVQASNIYQIMVENGSVSEVPTTAREIRDGTKTWGSGQWKGYLVEMSQGPQFETGVVSDTALDGSTLTDSTKSWTDDHWKGYSLKMIDGANADEVREIAGNSGDSLQLESPFDTAVTAGESYEIIRVDRRRITDNSTDTLQVATDFSYPVGVGDSFTIVMPNWRGGKFCWDCHDPHGDQNLNMIQNKVATRTDGWVGRPVTRETVSFTSTQELGLSYARINPPYDGICNVCHTDPEQHYGKDHGDGHNAGRACTECHEHRFTESHASQQPCNSCHQNRPVPRHSGFSQPRECTKCHNGTIGKRMNIMGQFNANSHHVQGVEVNSKHCYVCHWEADEHGLINREYHQGFNNKDFTSKPNREVDLVVWNSDTRPTEYIPGVTVTQFTASNMQISPADERAEVEKITPHCLGCHSDTNNDTEPFGDCKTPRQYSWDGSSIADRYEDTSTTTWGKYTDTADAAQKNIVKAFSGHGNAVNNGGGFSPDNGVDEAIPNTRAGNFNIQCFDCHNSHGSKVSGITSSYFSFKGDQNGANLKETQAGKGGYSMTYMASSYTNPQSVNYYEAGAGQCFDCHETQAAGVTPWGYNSTFEADAPIMGYADTMRFGQGVRGVASRYPYKKSTIMGGHMKPSSSISTPPLRQINGLCTPCHDPHGVSKSLGEDRAYGVPMLKGTWMTSPYKEDAALGGATTGRRENLPGSMYYDYSLPREPGPEVTPSVHTDQKTFGAERVKETAQTFAGLCLSCHPKENLTNGVDNDGAWKSIDRIHESVRGWGDNEMHSYTCSKCHRPHNSTLPRLMKTNCLNTNHRGQVSSGGQAGSNEEIQYYHGVQQNYLGSFPFGKADERATGDWGNYQVNCHPTGTWPDNSWNEVSPW